MPLTRGTVLANPEPLSAVSCVPHWENTQVEGADLTLCCPASPPESGGAQGCSRRDQCPQMGNKSLPQQHREMLGMGSGKTGTGIKGKGWKPGSNPAPHSCAGEKLGTRGFPHPWNGPWLASPAGALRGFTAAKGFLFWVFKAKPG